MLDQIKILEKEIKALCNRVEMVEEKIKTDKGQKLFMVSIKRSVNKIVDNFEKYFNSLEK